MNIPPPVLEATARARATGFAGVVDSTERAGDERHELWVVRMRFGDDIALYLVAADAHEGGGSPILLPLGDAVHCLQNMTEAERWSISGRDP